MRRSLTFLLWPLLAAALSAQRPGDADVATARGALAVESIHVFKDGHAVVVRAGTMPIDDRGRVVLTELPNAIMGAFWPSIVDDELALESVTVRRLAVTDRRPARTISELLRANPERRAHVLTRDGDLLIGVVGPPRDGGLVSLRLDGGGTRFLATDQVKELIFPEAWSGELVETRESDALELRLAGAALAARDRVAVRLLTVERGFRWHPSWRVDVTGVDDRAGAGRVAVELRATLVNDLVGVDAAEVGLVVGVPSFLFSGRSDAMSGDPAPRIDAFDDLLSTSNTITSQIVVPSAADRGTASGDAFEGGAAVDDLFVFAAGRRTLAKGERMTLVLDRFELDYEDVWALDVPISLPDVLLPYVRRGHGDHAAMARSPKAEHRLRLFNDRAFPLTTGPALVLKDGTAVAQGLITYTPPGASCDLGLTSTIDVGVEVEDQQVAREIDALRVDRDTYQRLLQRSMVTLVNRSDRSIVLDVRRWLPGTVDDAGEDGVVVKLNALSAISEGFDGGEASRWIGWSWPSWYPLLNGFSRVSWKVTLEPGERRTLTAAWSHYWR